jgi:hypothetical protein
MMPISVRRGALSHRQARQPHRRPGKTVAGSRGASKSLEAMAELWPATKALGRGGENNGSISSH